MNLYTVLLCLLSCIFLKRKHIRQAHGLLHQGWTPWLWDCISAFNSEQSFRCAQVFCRFSFSFVQKICVTDFLMSLWIESKCHIDGEIWLSPKHQLVRRESRCVIFGHIVCMYQGLYIITPVDLGGFLTYPGVSCWTALLDYHEDNKELSMCSLFPITDKCLW